MRSKNEVKDWFLFEIMSEDDYYISKKLENITGKVISLFGVSDDVRNKIIDFLVSKELNS